MTTIYQKCKICGEIIKGQGCYGSYYRGIQQARTEHMEKHKAEQKLSETQYELFIKEKEPIDEEYEKKISELEAKYPKRECHVFYFEYCEKSKEVKK